MSFDSTVTNLEGEPSGGSLLNHDAFKAFFKEHYPSYCIYCRVKYGFDLDLAEDIVNSGFTKLWEVRHSLTPESSLRAYMYKIVDNLCLNNLRHEKVRKKYEDHLNRVTPQDIPAASFDSIDAKQLNAAIDKAISELPEQMRKIFELKKIEGLKYSEIASHLNISIKTVDTQMSRAMAKLREKLSGFLFKLLL